MTRQYEPIWIKLKSLPEEQAKTVGVRITANKALHRRIIKAVIKEKYMDLGYKLVIEPKTAILDYRRENSILIFTLSFKRGMLKALTLNDI